MTTFLDFFNLSPNTLNVDFFNPNLEKDTPHYIDSYYLTWADSIHAEAALQTPKKFMQCLMSALKDKDELLARKLCSHFPEPKFTGIGVSRDSVNGRGSKDIKVERILNCLKSSKAAQTGLLEDLEELILVTEGIGADTISDITTNICFKHFAEYTFEKCNELNIPMKQSNEFFHYFCSTDLIWKKGKFSLPHVEWGKNKILEPVVLLPSQILDTIISYSSNYFFTNIATPLYKEEAIKKHPTASFIYSLKSGEKRVRVKKLRESHPEYRGGKKNMDELISKNPQLLEEYREKIARKRFEKRKGKKKK